MNQVLTYGYLVPDYFRSPWYRRGNVHAGDLNAPRVGVYCPHDPDPWLLGSLAHDAGLSERSGTPYWSWDLDYLTGDGYLIRLGRQAHGPTDTQFIVDNKPRDRDAEKREMKRAIETGLGTDEALARRNYAEANTRARVTMRCGAQGCGISRTFRMERLHEIASKLWSVGIREISLSSLAARVDRHA